MKGTERTRCSMTSTSDIFNGNLDESMSVLKIRKRSFAGPCDYYTCELIGHSFTTTRCLNAVQIHAFVVS